MLNKSTSRSKYVVQSGVTQYPVGFEFFFNGDDTPQIRVTIGAMVAEENLHFVISEDLLTINLIPLEEEAPVDPNDYSWMDKWVGMDLVIERDIPFVQESDYQLGRISPERIEKDFDLSVMRDQQLSDEFGDAVAKMEDISQGVEARLVEVEAKAEEALQGSWEAKDVAEEAHIRATDALPAAQQAEANSIAALEKAGTAESVANSVRDIADQANTNAQNAYANASAASVQASNAKVKADQALAEAQMARQVANSKADLSDLATRELVANKKTGKYTSRSEVEYPSIKVAEDIADLAVSQGKVGLQNQITTLQETSESHTTQLEELTGIVDDMEIQKADKEDIANIGGEGTVGQVLTKTEDGFSWQDATGGGVSGDYATVDYVDAQDIETVGYVDNIARQLKKNDDQLNENTQTVANWVNAKDSEGNRAVLETEAQDAYRAINELNAKIGTGGGDYLPLSGGTLTGILNFDYNEGTYGTETLITFPAHNGSLNVIRTGQGGAGLVINIPATAGGQGGVYRLSGSLFGPYSSDGTINLGFGSARWATVFATRLCSTSGYSGFNELIIPDKAGTLARIEDIEAAVGDISTALSAIIGE